MSKTLYVGKFGEIDRRERVARTMNRCPFADCLRGARGLGTEIAPGERHIASVFFSENRPRPVYYHPECFEAIVADWDKHRSPGITTMFAGLESS